MVMPSIASHIAAGIASDGAAAERHLGPEHPGGTLHPKLHCRVHRAASYALCACHAAVAAQAECTAWRLCRCSRTKRDRHVGRWQRLQGAGNGKQPYCCKPALRRTHPGSQDVGIIDDPCPQVHGNRHDCIRINTRCCSSSCSTSGCRRRLHE